MNEEQAKQLRDALKSASNLSFQLLAQIKSGGPIDFETETNAEAESLLSCIETDIDNARAIIDSL